MVVRIRLARWGAANNPFYGIVVANSRAARDGKHLERVGCYNSIPDHNRTKHLELKVDRIKYWLSVGAHPTERVAWLLSKVGLMPPTPNQLQNQGFVTFSNEKTWDVVIQNEEGKEIGAMPMADAIAQFGNDEKLAQALPIGPVEPLKHNIRYGHIHLDGRPPKQPLTPSEALMVLQGYTGIN